MYVYLTLGMFDVYNGSIGILWIL